MTTPTPSNEPPLKYMAKNLKHYVFVRKAMFERDGSVPLSQLANDEIVIAPGWIYREQYKEKAE